MFAEVVVDRPEGDLARPVPLGLGPVDLGEPADHGLGGGVLVLGPGEVELGAPHEGGVGPLEPEEAGVLPERGPGDEVELPPEPVQLAAARLVEDQFARAGRRRGNTRSCCGTRRSRSRPAFPFSSLGSR